MLILKKKKKDFFITLLKNISLIKKLTDKNLYFLFSIKNIIII